MTLPCPGQACRVFLQPCVPAVIGRGFLVRSLLTIHRNLDNVPVYGGELESIPDHRCRENTAGYRALPTEGCFVR